jgi:hypothetical protein
MRWLSDHAWDIFKTMIIAVIAVIGAWGSLQQRLADIDRRHALLAQIVNTNNGMVTRIEREYVVRNDELQKQLHEIQGQLADIGKAVAVLTDRANYRTGRNDEE